MEKNYEGEYFIFGVNSPHAVMVYGDGARENSCVVFQKVEGVLVPRGEDSRRWIRADTDEPPDRAKAIKYLNDLSILF